ncbi:5-carboxymethyl-2-hydroxymuconate Delta-isomerase [Uliginosibacterium aquaticum]|uniref:5-carboxymethyl-2-hydroxymuconate Delta-isomerase n=1 Tax=Uliginosibacterium aquaticum TaxID=2731212 RepID=A0ABX2IGB2_9RHOO|nr:5-carboxymethyl-2-hydroxymuconate Delta-isomerase [Uliginosibacterium aquaticum]NSL55761.1 5-carboxymethyl-2-hydroxymuconate Delta-isomerase [Uliginosibacterium aquaticum]
MPHLVLEYTANLLPDFEPAQALHRMNTVLLASGEFVPDHIKSRAIRLDDFLVGDAAPGSFLHARLHLLSGRDAATKQAITEGLVAALCSCVINNQAQPVQITAEALDMDRATYSKAIVQA